MKMTNYDLLDYPTEVINRDFRIKVYGHNGDGKKMNTLVGVEGMLKLIGHELANKFIARAYRDGLDKTVCKLRRGLKVSLYVK